VFNRINEFYKYDPLKKITFGTDYPFPLGDLTGGKFIEEMDISKKIKEDIFCNSTLEWLTISKKDFV
jgi:aminocarboxymuconate-semialdehyde decarboxylase